jgi:cysteine-rich repeat protein
VAAVGDQTLYVSSPPLCIDQDTLVGSYRLWTPQGSSPFVTGSGVYHVLPIPPVPTIPTFSATFPYVQSQVSGERRNVDYLTNPDRLIDSSDRETGSLINLTINIQNVQASLSTCGVNSRVCGNGTLDFNEQCDDGNTRNNDGCSSFCTREAIALCGNNLLDAGEECDDGNRVDHDGCSGLCFLETPVCGNLFLETGEVCDDGNLVNGDGCSNTCQIEVLPVCGNSTIDIGETCDDGNIRNGDGCSSSCRLEGPAACNDHIDNDRDGLVDMLDPGCSNPNDTSEFNLTIVTPTSTPNVPFLPGTETVLNPIGNTIQMWIAQRSISANLINGVVYSLPGDQLTVSVSVPFSENVSSTILEFNGNSYTLIKDNATDRYIVDVIMPPVGRYDAVVTAAYGNNSRAIIPFAIESLSFGSVQSSAGVNLSGASILLLDDDGNTWNGSQFFQQNPGQTNANGEFGYLLPNGIYRVSVSREGYVDQSRTIDVSNHVLNPKIELTLLSDGTLLGTLNELRARAEQLLDNARENLRRAGKKVKQFVNDPEVKRVAEHVVEPATIVGVSVVVLPSLAETAIPLFRYLFLQPLLIFGRKKREKWGMVYNSLTKLPVDLSIVRLISKEGKVIQSRVTDRGGRFIFFVDPGTYKLEIRRNGFVFPSRILANVSVDGSKIDLYHGEPLSINEEGHPITPNIPIDPGEITHKPWQIIFKKRLHILQHVLSLAGFVMSVAVFYIQPTIKTFAMLAVQLALYVVFLYFIRPIRPKEWGGVVNAQTGKPIGKAIIRLFEKQYNKLVAMEVTSGNGRYAFLVGQNEYYLTVESDGFEAYQRDGIRVADAKGSFVGERISLRPIK